MEAFYAVAGIVTVAAITPGPNNFLVMGAAARGGTVAAAPAIASVVFGSLALLALVWAGAGAAFGAEPRLRLALTLAGGAYLIWLGAGLIWRTGRNEHGGKSSTSRGLPSTALGIAAFQLVNPKSWALVLTASAATFGAAQGFWTFAILALIFTAVTSLCLTLWALAGSAIAGLLEEPRARRWFDRVMGGLLIGSAGLLLV